MILQNTQFQSALEYILSNISRVRQEIDIVVGEVERNQDNVQGLEAIFELRYLEEGMTELAKAVDSIPTVYDLNKRYETFV